MLEGFTRAAREVVTNAVEFAGDRGDSRIGTEHLLAQDSIRRGPAANEWPKRKRHIPINRAGKAVLEGTLREALTMKHRTIGSEHILAALTATGSADPARRILAGLG